VICGVCGEFGRPARGVTIGARVGKMWLKKGWCGQLGRAERIPGD